MTLSFSQWMSTGLPSNCAPPEQLLPLSSKSSSNNKAPATTQSASDEVVVKDAQTNRKESASKKTTAVDKQHNMDGSTSSSQTEKSSSAAARTGVPFNQWFSTGLPSSCAPPEQLVPLRVTKATPAVPPNTSDEKNKNKTNNKEKVVSVHKTRTVSFDKQQQSEHMDGSSSSQTEKTSSSARTGVPFNQWFSTGLPSSCAPPEQLVPLRVTKATPAVPPDNSDEKKKNKTKNKEKVSVRKTRTVSFDKQQQSSEQNQDTSVTCSSISRSEQDNIGNSAKTNSTRRTSDKDKKITKEKRIGTMIKSTNAKAGTKNNKRPPKSSSSKHRTPTTKLDDDDVDNIYQLVMGAKQDPQGQQMLQDFLIKHATCNNGKGDNIMFKKTSSSSSPSPRRRLIQELSTSNLDNSGFFSEKHRAISSIQVPNNDGTSISCISELESTHH